MLINWSTLASKDLEEIVDYILVDNPSSAFTLYETIRQAVEKLQDYPNMGRIGRVSDTRELVITNTSFIVAYRVKNNTSVMGTRNPIALRWGSSLRTLTLYC